MVSYTINLLLTGTTKRDPNPVDAPLAGAVDARNSYHFFASGQTALPVDSMGNPWTGQNVFSSGNLKLDLRHNFFLECGARANKIRWSPDDYRRVGEVWNGPHPEDGSELIVEDSIPEGFPPPDLEAEPQLTAPGVDAGFMQEAAARLFR